MPLKKIKRVAVMQPYFIPYSGFFRLLAQCDLFVIYDCVQFTRRGWLHRNKLTNFSGRQEWLTLPLEKAPQNILIKDLLLSTGAEKEIKNRLLKFPLNSNDKVFKQNALLALFPSTLNAVDYIWNTLEFFMEHLDIECKFIKSSSLGVPRRLQGVDRVIEIVTRVKGTHYLNAPGGRKLYQDAQFSKSNLKLEILSDFEGDTSSILNRTLLGEKEVIKRELMI